jgi:hypothetical protein
MAFLVGTDEAGYGPNLGPLVISASVWQVSNGVEKDGLYEPLAAAVSRAPQPGGDGAVPRVAIADSKLLYHSGHGLRLLERGLWSAWAVEERSEESEPAKIPRTVGEVWQRLAGWSAAGRQAALCDGCDDQPAPLDAQPEELGRLRPIVEETLRVAGVRLIGLRSLAIFPDEFNETVGLYGSKGEALSRWTLGLVARVTAPLGAGPISIVCDKHGGRNHYLPLLLDFFPDGFIETHGEGRQRSVYRFGPQNRRVEISFQAKGESHLPTALASMASKYLRELAMRALGEFWCRRVPGLRPTAGYPQDARRFRDEIAPVQRALGIEDRVLWRER